MKYRYDLQMHSDLSDGDYSIEKVFQLAKKADLRVISITDHNTAEFMNRKKSLAIRYGLQHIDGIEISTKFHKTEVHILGYAYNFDLTKLKAGMKSTINGYNQRAKMMIKKYNSLNKKKIDFKEIKKIKGANLALTKYDLAKYISRKTKISPRTIQKIFNSGGPAYVPYGKWAMPPEKAIRIIHQASGWAILSHPGETLQKFIKKFGRTQGEKIFKIFLKKLLNNSLDGLEVFTPKNSLLMQKKLLLIAKKNNLMITGGSDWHGDIHHPELTFGSGGLSKKRFIDFQNKLKSR